MAAAPVAVPEAEVARDGVTTAARSQEEDMLHHVSSDDGGRAARDGHGDVRHRRRRLGRRLHKATETVYFTTQNFLRHMRTCVGMVDFYGAYGAGGRTKRDAFLCFSFLHESVLC
jgi:hypothetical protein